MRSPSAGVPSATCGSKTITCRRVTPGSRNDAGDLSIEDLGSTNGTYVNQELVKGRVHLERGDIVQVGGVLFEVVR